MCFYSDSGLTKAAITDRHRFGVARPWRRCETEKSQRLVTDGPKLKRDACRDDHRRARGNAGRCAVDPDFAATIEEIPDLFHGPMLHRPAHAAWPQHHLDETRALPAELAVVDLRPVRRNRVRR